MYLQSATQQLNGQKVLIVGTETDFTQFMAVAFKCEGYAVEIVDDGEQVVNILTKRHHEFSAVWLELEPERSDAVASIKGIRAITKDLPVLVTSDASAMSNATIVEAMRAGATDFLWSPFSPEQLWKHMSEHAIMARMPREAGQTEGLPHHVMGTSQRMKEIQSSLHRISASEAPVLIQGETGCGKEVLARQIHALSPRASGPFVKLNCAALPSELVESELFGYERGAFTGAFQRKAGMFELADHGTMLLDEIGDMDFKLQAKLLQVLQDREFQRLGGKEAVQVDVRVIAATHRNLQQAIQNETFREDLYYRLNVVTLHLPPLRERKEDISSLAQSFLEKYAGSSPTPSLPLSLQQSLLQYDWPGNVRELENVIRRYTILQDRDELMRYLSARSNTCAMRNSGVRDESATTVPDAAMDRLPRHGQPARQSSVLHDVEQAKANAEVHAILNALETTHWNRKRAARVLNLEYKALLYRMRKFNIGETRTQAATG